MRIWRPSREELRDFAVNPPAFRASLKIDAGKKVAQFRPDPWQDENLRALDPLWMRAVGIAEYDGPKLAWLGRPRGHSKTTDEAMQLTWAVGFSTKQISGIAAAGVREQARFIRDGVLKIALLNPWLLPKTKRNPDGLGLIDVQNYRVYNPRTNSEVDIISSDAPGSYGADPHFVLCDELTHWSNEELWESLFSSADKRSDTCCLVVMTNAGYRETWQWRLFQDARSRPDEWVFRNLDGPVASWISRKALARQERLLPPKPFSRLWLNEWQVEAGDALSEDDVLASIDGNLRPMSGREKGWTFVGGIDLSTKRHRSALVMLAANQEMQIVRLAGVQSFKPGSDGMVDLVALQSAFRAWHSKFAPAVWCYDPHQAALLAQQAQVDGIPMREVPFGSKNLGLMASSILQIFRSRQIELYNDKDLVSDILKLRIVEKAFGMKLEAPEDESGHADRAFALAVALPAAIEYASIVPIRCFINRPIAQTLDELVEKQHNLDKESAGSEVTTLTEPVMNPLSRRRIEDKRDVFVRAIEENAVTFGEEMDAA